MARATQKKTTVKIKAKSPSGNRMVCNICHGTGYQNKPTKKK